MEKPKSIKEMAAAYAAPVADLSHPIILQRDGQAFAVLISIEEYERYRALIQEHGGISALEARRAADRAVLGDLVGCALSSDEPTWMPTPQPHWQVPYRHLNGTLLATVEVDALSGTVSLTDEQRHVLLTQVERLTASRHAT